MRSESFLRMEKVEQIGKYKQADASQGDQPLPEPGAKAFVAGVGFRLAPQINRAGKVVRNNPCREHRNKIEKDNHTQQRQDDRKFERWPPLEINFRQPDLHPNEQGFQHTVSYTHLTLPTIYSV